MDKAEARKAFFDRLDSLPDADLTDKDTLWGIHERLSDAIRPEIEKQERLQAKSLSRAFTKVVR